jgi:hypothetical protein
MPFKVRQGTLGIYDHGFRYLESEASARRQAETGRVNEWVPEFGYML